MAEVEDPIVDGYPLSTMRVIDLKNKLKELGLSNLGNKAALADRLREYLLSGTVAEGSPAKESPQKEKSSSPVKSPDRVDNPLVASYLAKQQQQLKERARRESEASTPAEDEKSDVQAEPEESPSGISDAENGKSESPSRKVEEVKKEAPLEEEVIPEAKTTDEKDQHVQKSAEPEISEKNVKVKEESNDVEMTEDTNTVSDPEVKPPRHTENEKRSKKGEEKGSKVDVKENEKESVKRKRSVSPEPSKEKKEENGKENEDEELDYGDGDERREDKDEVLEEDSSSKRKEVSKDKDVSPPKRQVSPSRHPESDILHIRGLVRPFTVPQLKAEICKHGGEIVEFWIDGIKSHCFAKMRSVDEARTVRENLHATNWPDSNPKQLSVQFDTLDNMERHKSGASSTTPAPLSTSRRTLSSDKEREARPVLGVLPGRNTSLRVTVENAVRDNSKRDVELRERTEREKEKMEMERRAHKEAREQEDRERASRKRNRSPSPKRTAERERKQSRREEPEKEKEEEPQKTPEEFFQKTKTRPYIYFLPLTEEQAAERLKKREAERKDRSRN